MSHVAGVAADLLEVRWGVADVHYLRYWVEEAAGRIYCLVDAPDPEAAHRVHRQAHGLVADELHLVVEGA